MIVVCIRKIDVERNEMDEIFVAVKEVDYIEAQIDTLCNKYNNYNRRSFLFCGGFST